MGAGAVMIRMSARRRRRAAEGQWDHAPVLEARTVHRDGRHVRGGVRVGRLRDRSNRTTHGVAFADAATVFRDAQALVIADPDHSVDEARFVMLGLSFLGRAARRPSWQARPRRRDDVADRVL